jgi:ADP-ribosylarginine hydrolase
MVLAGLGDCFGFYNGSYEFNYGNRFDRSNFGVHFAKAGANFSNFLVFDFIRKGGFSKHPKEDMRVSDDTVLHVTVAEALLKADTVKNFVKQTEKNLVACIDTPEKEAYMTDVLMAGITTMKNLKLLRMGTDWRSFRYDEEEGGTGACMRSMCIGLALHRPSDVEMMMVATFESAMVTHKNAIAFLGAFASAYLTSLAVQRVEPKRWGHELVSVLTTNMMDNFIEKRYKPIYKDYIIDKNNFLIKWKTYLEMRFRDDEWVHFKALVVPSERSKMFSMKFAHNKEEVMYPGAGGDDSVIFAYDAFLDASDNWEALMVNAMFHVGDSDTTGSIAGAFYGAYHGFKNVPKHMLQKFRERDNLLGVGERLYDKFVNKKIKYKF